MMLKGTHGTCIANANQIRENGFILSSTGKRGSGAYFWVYASDALRAYAKELAISWWKYAKNRGSYAKKENTNGCIIYVAFEFENDDILDLERQDIRDKFIEYNIKTSPRLDTDEDISYVYDMFINEIEKRASKSFKVIHVRVQQPNGTRKILPLDITGQPSCYVVKDIECLSIEEFEEVRDE